MGFSRSFLRTTARLAVCIALNTVSGVALAQTQSGPSADGIGLSADHPQLSKKYSFSRSERPVLTLGSYSPGYGTQYVPAWEEEFAFESLSAPIIIRRKASGGELLPPLVFDLESYNQALFEKYQASAWKEYFVRAAFEDERTTGRGGLKLDIPVKIRSKTFQRIFGSGTVGLTVTGDIRIQAGLRREDRSEVKNALTRGSNTNLKMEQQQRFAVKGNIGDKVSINVDQDSERAFDFDNNVSLVYEGYGDEIIRRISAGNISLTLPGTRYVTFSGQSTGLFGLKSELQLGDLSLTTIASQEKGESQQLSLQGGATEGTKQIEDHRYMRNTYFFLDTLYRSEYKKLVDFNGTVSHVALGSRAIKRDSIEVYISEAGYETRFPDLAIQGWATFSGAPEDTLGGDRDGAVRAGYFRRLERTEYIIRNELGYLRVNAPLSESEVLAVAYVREDGQLFGDLHYDPQSGNRIVLKLIKDNAPYPSHATWALEWKHVYPLGGRDIQRDGFDVKLFYDPPSGADEEFDTSTGRKWVTVFELDNVNESGAPEPDGVIDNDDEIVDFAFGELHFRDLRPFDPEGYTINGTPVVYEIPGNLRSPALYDTTNQNAINAASKFYMEVTSKSRSTDFDLGFNVIENSETVTLDGQRLQKGSDYTIDYFSGKLNVLDPRAANSSSDLNVTWEQNQLFQLEKKTMLGMRADYDLGNQSFIGGTFLYLNESTLDRKVRVGRGPMRNMVWDVNTRLNFNPNFIGQALDWLPIVRAQGETSLDFEGEIAQVLPTPNTLNNSDTEDNRGVAYIDDFEGSKKTTSLGVIKSGWVMASEPADGPLHTYRNRFDRFVWYNPYYRVPIREIYPKRDVSGLTGNTARDQHVLTLQVHPDPQNHTAETWAGVMRALSPGYYDQTQTRFIEIMVQGDEGTLHIDFGTISEDIISNGVLDTEDRKIGGIRDGILEPVEDVGLDGVDKPDPPEFFFPRSSQYDGMTVEDVPYDFWDVNNNRIKDPDEPWSFDNWFYPESEARKNEYIQPEGSPDAGSISGTQGNINDQGGRLPDTEDINGNGALDRSDNYFSFSFSLETGINDPLVVGGNPDAPGRPWKLYRIPFATEAATEIVGSPDFTRVQYVRIWLDSFEPAGPDPLPITVRIADISLIGSDWQEQGTTVNEYSSSALNPELKKVKVSQLNTHDNADIYDPDVIFAETGVRGQEDRVSRVIAREQALVLEADTLLGGEAGIVKKSLFRADDYIHYKRIKMFVYGLDSTGTHISTDTSQVSHIEYFIRFGANENNYYEYRSRVYQGWEEKNWMDASLPDFARLSRGDSLTTDFTNYDPATDTYWRYIDGDTTRTMRVKGLPSLDNVKELILGLKNLHPSGEPFHGQVWFNELRLSEVEQERGIAMRMKGDLRVGSFGSINAEIESKDADFHDVKTRFGTGSNSDSKRINASVNLDSFLPRSWGLGLPLTVNHRATESTPKYFPGQDRLVTDDLTIDELTQVRTLSRQSGFNFSFRKSTQSKNFFVKNTVDNIGFSIGNSTTHNESPTTKFNDSRAWNGKFDYSLKFGANNYVSFLKWLPNLPLIKKAKETRLYYTPQTLSVGVTGNKNTTASQNRINRSDVEAPINNTENFTIDRRYRGSMKVFENLSFDITRTYQADMREKDLSDFFRGDFEDINMTQSFQARYSPNVFSWLTNSFNYNANYSFQNSIQEKNTGRRATNNATRSADITFKWKTLVQSIFGSGKKSSTPGRGRTRPPQEQQQQYTVFQTETSSGGGFNPLSLVGGFFSRFKDIRFNYSERTNINQSAMEQGSVDPLFIFGLTDSTGLRTVEGYNQNTLTAGDNTTYRLNSGLDFGRNVDISLTYEQSEQANRSTNNNGSTSESWLSAGSFDIPFPNWTVRVSNLNQLPLINKLIKTMTFTHTYNGKRDISWAGSVDSPTQERISTNFRPLGKLDFSFANGLTANVQVNHTVSLTDNISRDGQSRDISQDYSITANYSKRRGFRLPFMTKALNNSIDFSFSFTSSSSIRESAVQTKRDEQGNEILDSNGDPVRDWQETNSTDRWSLSPRVNYSFSDRVRGGAFFEVGGTESKTIGKTSIQEFGINVNIQIRD